MKQEGVHVVLAERLVNELFLRAGLSSEKAFSVTEILLEGELLGHRTHGLHLVKPYLEHLEKGAMEKEGSVEVLNAQTATELWNGRYLPGPWVVQKALGRATEMATLHGTGTIVIQRCSHIGCLAAYLEEAASRGFLVIIACSDPDNRTVAPFGGTEGVYSPNPLALGIPSEGDPIIIDVSMSATSNGLIHQKKNEGRQLEHPLLLTADGKPTTDPETFFQNPPSTILPLGGTESGYKGFALGIMIEALTSALGGYGRVKEPGRWGASTFVQVISPDSMAGRSYFQNEIQNLRDQCLSSKPIHTDQPVRLPGEAGLQRKRFQLQNGLSLRADTLEMLNNLAQSAGLQSLS